MRGRAWEQESDGFEGWKGWEGWGGGGGIEFGMTWGLDGGDLSYVNKGFFLDVSTFYGDGCGYTSGFLTMERIHGNETWGNLWRF